MRLWKQDLWQISHAHHADVSLLLFLSCMVTQHPSLCCRPECNRGANHKGGNKQLRFVIGRNPYCNKDASYPSTGYHTFCRRQLVKVVVIRI